MTNTRIALATLAVLASLPAAAQTAAPTQAPKAAAATPEERRAALQAMDSDKDGKLSKAEWLAAGRSERGFAMADANGDGFADQAELRALAERVRAYRVERATAPSPAPGSN